MKIQQQQSNTLKVSLYWIQNSCPNAETLLHNNETQWILTFHFTPGLLQFFFKWPGDREPSDNCRFVFFAWANSKWELCPHNLFYMWSCWRNIKRHISYNLFILVLLFNFRLRTNDLDTWIALFQNLQPFYFQIKHESYRKCVRACKRKE